MSAHKQSKQREAALIAQIGRAGGRTISQKPKGTLKKLIERGVVEVYRDQVSVRTNRRAYTRVRVVNPSERVVPTFRMEFRDHGRWLKSGLTFESVEQAKEHADLIGARKIRVFKIKTEKTITVAYQS